MHIEHIDLWADGSAYLQAYVLAEQFPRVSTNKRATGRFDLSRRRVFANF